MKSDSYFLTELFGSFPARSFYTFHEWISLVLLKRSGETE